MLFDVDYIFTGKNIIYTLIYLYRLNLNTKNIVMTINTFF